MTTDTAGANGPLLLNSVGPGDALDVKSNAVEPWWRRSVDPRAAVLKRTTFRALRRSTRRGRREVPIALSSCVLCGLSGGHHHVAAEGSLRPTTVWKLLDMPHSVHPLNVYLVCVVYAVLEGGRRQRGHNRKSCMEGVFPTSAYALFSSSTAL